MLVATRSCGVGWEHVLCFIECLFSLVHPSLCFVLCLSLISHPPHSLPSFSRFEEHRGTLCGVGWELVVSQSPPVRVTAAVLFQTLVSGGRDGGSALSCRACLALKIRIITPC